MKQGSVTISVILPVLNEQDHLEGTVQKIVQQLESLEISYEIVIVDDGSSDNTWRIIKRIRSSNPHIGVIRFTRNFGKEAAMFAGLSYSNGQAAIIMDADLQHPPEILLWDFLKLNFFSRDCFCGLAMKGLLSHLGVM